MNHLQIIQRYLDEKRSLLEIPDSGYPFVTISRQTGAGAHLLTQALLAELKPRERTDLYRGWHVFDRELFEIVAQDPTLRGALEPLAAERYPSEFKQFMDSLFTGRSDPYLSYKRTFHVVRMLAAIGKVILVGRAGCCVTRDLRAGVHVRLVAPEHRRIFWLMQRYQLTREEARRIVAKLDVDRAKLIKLFFNRNIDDPLLYDVVWNTDQADVRTIAASVMQLIEDRATRKRKSEALAGAV